MKFTKSLANKLNNSYYISIKNLHTLLSYTYQEKAHLNIYIYTNFEN